MTKEDGKRKKTLLCLLTHVLDELHLYWTNVWIFFRSGNVPLLIIHLFQIEINLILLVASYRDINHRVLY